VQPEEGPDVALPCEPGRLVIFRHDRLSFTYEPAGDDALALQAWILSEGRAIQIDCYEGPNEQYDKALGLMNGPPAPAYGVTGSTVSLMSMDTMLAMNGYGPEFFWTGLISGCDGGRHLASIRWDPEMYYIGDKDLAFGRYYSNHGGFVLEETCLAFDHEFFGLTEEQTYNCDPCQRNCMEIGYSILHKAGWDRTSLNGARIGVFVGNCGTDWHSVRLNPAGNLINPDWMNSSSAHTTNSRLSYIFGMRGPLSTSDTACSSSLVAAGTAHNALRRMEPDQLDVSSNSFIDWALVLGTNGLWGPYSWIGLCGPKMLSSMGRCFTFDHSADGFARGEGTSGISVSITDKDHAGRLAMFCGTCINQDGRSASMTAPHGPSQQECLRASMREANIVPGDVRVAELHGTGTALGDPIEVGALRGVMKNRSTPINKTSAKSNLEHAEGNAGMAGLVKCFILLMHGSCPPNIHLADLNPHIDAHAYPVLFANEMTDLGTSSGYAGVSSFGFGGTNARADLWAKATAGPRKTGTLDEEKIDFITVRCPRCLGWMDHVGAGAMPNDVPKPQVGRFKACCIRDEFATYEYCSFCYTGGYQYGNCVTESPMPPGRLYVKGTWDGMSSHREGFQTPDGVYHFFARLGETRVERFYFCLEKSDGWALFPAAENAGPEIRTMGPKKFEEGHYWLVDGRDKQWSEGDVLHITVSADKSNGSRKVAWETLADSDLPAGVQVDACESSYSVAGSWTGGRLVPMTPVRGAKRRCFEVITRIGVTGRETFHFARHGDENQLIYPAERSTHRPNVPIRGPDNLGKDRNWLVAGSQNETLTIRLEVENGHVAVAVRCASVAARWESSPGQMQRQFGVSGSWLEEVVPMDRDADHQGVYRLRAVLPSDFEEFVVVVDGDPGCTLHPEVAGFGCGEVLVCGPDDQGLGRRFQIQGEAGTDYEIVLDLASEDKRHTVSWKPVQDDGSLFLPWSAAAKYGICDKVAGR